ncbi:MAG: hypothetical protein EOO40_04000 [Deltaproteobacteria bacterium]|nr:MAG: hypothetical protein EOO40_04000 [Deltaproteobacteria bacterium]
MSKLFTAFFLSAALAAGPARAQWSGSAAQNTTVRDAAGVQEQVPRTTPGPNGGTYVAWFETVSGGGNYAARRQLLDVNGRPQFVAAGLLVSNQPQSSALYRYDLETDAAGNALLAFQDVRSANGSIQVIIYKISPTGQQLWGANGIPLLDATTN